MRNSILSWIVVCSSVATPLPILAENNQTNPTVSAPAQQDATQALAGRLLVTGQLEQVAVKQSPDPQVNAPLIEALKNWTFQPSLVDGKPVALKILLDIRLPAR